MSKTFELSPSSVALRDEVEEAIVSGKRRLIDYAVAAAHSGSIYYFAVLAQAHYDGTLARLSVDGGKLSSESRATLKAWREAQGIVAPSQRDEATRVITLAARVIALGTHDWRNASSRSDLRAMANDKPVAVITVTESATQDAERLARSQAAAASEAASEAAAEAAAAMAASLAATNAAAEATIEANLGEIAQLRVELAAAAATIEALRTELAAAMATAAATAAATTKAKATAKRGKVAA